MERVPSIRGELVFVFVWLVPFGRNRGRRILTRKHARWEKRCRDNSTNDEWVLVGLAAGLQKQQCKRYKVLRRKDEAVGCDAMMLENT